MLKKIIIPIFMGVILFAELPQVETFLSKIQSDDINQYLVKDPNALTMKINIWGAVNQPGQYLIPYSMKLDIISLISVAGGPTSEANLKKIILIRAEDELNQSGRQKINMDEFFKNGSLKELPELNPNDTIIVQQSFFSRLNSNHTIFNLLQFLATVYLITIG